MRADGEFNIYQQVDSTGARPVERVSTRKLVKYMHVNQSNAMKNHWSNIINHILFEVNMIIMLFNLMIRERRILNR